MQPSTQSDIIGSVLRTRDGETFIVLCRDNTTDDAIRQIWRWAADPDIGLTLAMAGMMDEDIRKVARN
jgi:hypothetical protein